MKSLTANIAWIMGLAAVISLSSCEMPKRASSSGQTQSAQASKSQHVAAVPSRTKQKTLAKDNTLPTDRRELEAHADPKAYTPEEFGKGIIKGDWAIESVGGKKAVGEVPPFIKFSATEGKIYGNNGCNTINAEYEYNPVKRELKFINPIVTMRLCAMEGITDGEINKALGDTRYYELKETDDSYRMTLLNAQKEAVMTLSHQNLDFLNGTWRVVSIDGREINVEKMKLVFDIDENKVHGNTGCNVLNGRLETNMDEPNTFSFESMAVTMMMCPEIEYQQAMLVALEEACRAKPISKNEVMLLDDEGECVMILERTSDR